MKAMIDKVLTILIQKRMKIIIQDVGRSFIKS